jgi:pre-60S factor REI1
MEHEHGLHQPDSTKFSFTCITCQVAFRDAESQHQHYRTDWHRYNLKRRVVSMVPISANQFSEIILIQQEKTQSTQVTKCTICRKYYASENAYKNHLESKKHKENVLREALGSYSTSNVQKDESKPSMKTRRQSCNVDMTLREGEDEITAMDRIFQTRLACSRRLTLEECLFCRESSDTFDQNMSHMMNAHSLFIPDMEYMINLRGLIAFLGEKISVGYLCLFCNGKGQGFHSLEAVQTHMRDKGHCKILYEGDAEEELAEFYDFTSSYIDFDDTRWAEQAQVAIDGSPGLLIEDSRLVLPSGVKLGHRLLRHYYRQRFYQPKVRMNL